MRVIIKKEPGRFLAAMAAGMLRSVAAMGTSLLLSFMTASVLSEDTDGFRVFVVMSVCYVAGYGILYYFAGITGLSFGKKVRLMMKKGIFGAILYLNGEDFECRTENGHLAYLNQSTDTLESDYVNQWLELVYQSVSFLAAIVLMSYFNAMLAVLLLFLGGCYLITGKYLNQKLSDCVQKLMRCQESEAQSLQELIWGNRDIVQYGAGERMARRHMERVKETAGVYYRRNILNSLYFLLFLQVMNGMSLVILYAGALMNARGAGMISLGSMLAMQEMTIYLIRPVTAIGEAWTRIQGTRGLRGELKELMRKGQIGRESWLVPRQLSIPQTDLMLEHVDLGYDSRILLKDVNLCIPWGSKCAVIGKSGEGKTTLIRAVLGLLAPMSGRLTIGGIAYDGLSFADLNGKIAYVSQEPYLFSDTIRNNITAGKEWNRETYEQAIRTANVEEILTKHPEGDQTRCDQEGGLSGGERQRICIARALYAGRPVLILDEPSSALDQENAAEILSRIRGMERTTALVVLHHAGEEELRQYDRVLEVTGGRVREAGRLDYELNGGARG